MPTQTAPAPHERYKTWREQGYNHAEIIQKFHQLIQENPTQAEAYFGLGLTFWNKNDLPQAKRAFLHTIQLNPNLKGAYQNLAKIAEKQGDFSLALDYCDQYEAAIASIDKECDSRYANYYIKYAEQGKLDEAIEIAERRLHQLARHQKSQNLSYEAIKSRTQHHTNLGIFYNQSEQFELAKYHYYEAFNIGPGNPWTCFSLANFLARKEQFDEAIKIYQRAIRIYPSRPEFHESLAGVYVYTQQFKLALQHYLDVLALNVGRSQTYEALSHLLRACDQPVAAQQCRQLQLATPLEQQRRQQRQALRTRPSITAMQAAGYREIMVQPASEFSVSRPQTIDTERHAALSLTRREVSDAAVAIIPSGWAKCGVDPIVACSDRQPLRHYSIWLESIHPEEAEQCHKLSEKWV